MTYHSLTNSHLTLILDLLHETLEEDEILHVIEPIESDPNCYLCAAYDGERIHGGFVGWDGNAVIFFALDDESEDGPDDRAGWDAKNLDIFLCHLTGEIDDIVDKAKRLGALPAIFQQFAAFSP